MARLKDIRSWIHGDLIRLLPQEHDPRSTRGRFSASFLAEKNSCAPSSSLDAKPGRPLTCPPIRSPPAAAKFKSSRFCFPIMWWSERTGRGSRLLMGPIHDRVEPRVNISIRFLEPPLPDFASRRIIPCSRVAAYSTSSIRAFALPYKVTYPPFAHQASTDTAKLFSFVALISGSVDHVI